MVSLDLYTFRFPYYLFTERVPVRVLMCTRWTTANKDCYSENLKRHYGGVLLLPLFYGCSFIHLTRG